MAEMDDVPVAVANRRRPVLHIGAMTLRLAQLEAADAEGREELGFGHDGPHLARTCMGLRGSTRCRASAPVGAPRSARFLYGAPARMIRACLAPSPPSCPPASRRRPRRGRARTRPRDPGHEGVGPRRPAAACRTHSGSTCTAVSLGADAAQALLRVRLFSTNSTYDEVAITASWPHPDPFSRARRRRVRLAGPRSRRLHLEPAHRQPRPQRPRRRCARHQHRSAGAGPQRLQAGGDSSCT